MRPSSAAGSLAGVTPGVLVLAAVLLALRVAGLPALAAFAIAAPVGVLVTVARCRAHGGPEPAVGLAVVLTLSYSMLAGVLVVFVLAVAGVD